MITEQAIVIRCDGVLAEVEFQRQSSCSHCELSKGCGTGSLGRLLGKRNRPVVIDCGRAVQPGDHLLLGVSEAALVKSSLLVYGLPLAGLLLASLLATLISGLPEWQLVLIAIAGFFGGHKLASIISERIGIEVFSPKILDVHVNPQTLSGS